MGFRSPTSAPVWRCYQLGRSRSWTSLVSSSWPSSRACASRLPQSLGSPEHEPAESSQGGPDVLEMAPAGEDPSLEGGLDLGLPAFALRAPGPIISWPSQSSRKSFRLVASLLTHCEGRVGFFPGLLSGPGRVSGSSANLLTHCEGRVGFFPGLLSRSGRASGLPGRLFLHWERQVRFFPGLLSRPERTFSLVRTPFWHWEQQVLFSLTFAVAASCS